MARVNRREVLAEGEIQVVDSLASAGRVPFRQLRCILFVVGKTATRQSMQRRRIAFVFCAVFGAALVLILVAAKLGCNLRGMMN